MARICWHTIFLCGKPQWYGKPLKQRRLLSRQADIRRGTGASRIAFLPRIESPGARRGRLGAFVTVASPVTSDRLGAMADEKPDRLPWIRYAGRRNRSVRSSLDWASAAERACEAI